MKLHRFIGNFDLVKNDIRIVNSELINQVRNVLRLEKNAEVLLCDGKLNEAKSKILQISKDFIAFEILERWQNISESKAHVVLYCAILKRENFEWVVQKATEIGVKEIVPVVTERTVKLKIRPDRLEKIIKEASEQSGRGIVPELREAVSLKIGIIDESKKNDVNLFLDISGMPFSHPSEPNESLSNSKRQDNVRRIGVWIGPEGGWTSQELELAHEPNFKKINLGQFTLRAETAAIIGTYLTIHNF